MSTFLKILKIILVCLIISIVLCVVTDYGIITYYTIDSKKYSSDEDLYDSLNLDHLPDQEKAWRIYSEVEQQLEHKFTHYSFLENPISVVFEALFFVPLYRIVLGKKSQFLNTIREPYLLFNAGGGICHQSAIAMVLLAEKAKLEARVLWIEGHGVSEVYYNNQWHLFDANMGIVFKTGKHILSYNEIIAKPQLIYNTLKDKGWDAEQVQKIAEMYLTTDDNYFYHLHPYEGYINVYYFVTRMLSYTLYILMLFAIGYFYVKMINKRKHFVSS